MRSENDRKLPRKSIIKMSPLHKKLGQRLWSWYSI